MESNQNKYYPKFIWVDSRVKGVGKSWYYGGCDQMKPEDLQSLLEEYDACICYKDEFYNNVADVPFTKAIRTYYTYGMPSGYIEEEPTVTVVPNGTKWDDSPFAQYVGTKRFVFPKDK